jgi:hypothetical protein
MRTREHFESTLKGGRSRLFQSHFIADAKAIGFALFFLSAAPVWAAWTGQDIGSVGVTGTCPNYQLMGLRPV